MAGMTIYCVQPYWRAAPSKLARGELRQFKRRDLAQRAVESSARRVGGAIMYSVTGDPDYGHWDAPKLIQEVGEVPEVRF